MGKLGFVRIRGGVKYADTVKKTYRNAGTGVVHMFHSGLWYSVENGSVENGSRTARHFKRKYVEIAAGFGCNLTDSDVSFGSKTDRGGWSYQVFTETTRRFNEKWSGNSIAPAFVFGISIQTKN